MRFCSVLLLSFTLITVACSPNSKVPEVDDALAAKEADIQREIALKDSRQHYERLQKVATPIFLANTDLCNKKVGPFFGAMIVSTDFFPKEYKDTVQRLYGLEEQATVYYVDPLSPAVGILQERDLVLAVNGKKIREGKSGVTSVNKLMADKDLLDKPTTLKISRGGVEQEVTITPKTSCVGRAFAADTTSINAYADGKNIIVTTGMMNFATQDKELALVIGHELAHNSRKHVEAKKKNAMLGMVLGAVVTGVTGVNVMGLGQGLGAGAYSQSFEYEADYVGLYHTARAGYDISEAPNFWRRMGAKHPAAIHLKGTSHPSSAKRFVALEETVAEINAKKASGTPLVPEEQEKEEHVHEERGLN